MNPSVSDELLLDSAKSPLDDYLFLTKNLGSPFLWTHRLEYTGTRLRAEALGQAALLFKCPKETHFVPLVLLMAP